MTLNSISFGVNRYSVTGNYLNLKYALLLFICSLLIGTFGFRLLEGYSVLEGFYMAVITISTVGYTEVKPLSSAGQLFSSLYIIMNVGIFAYAIAAFTKYVIHGEVFKTMHKRMIKSKISGLKDHVIICGFGKYGKEISRLFTKHNIDFVIIERDEEVIDEIQKSPDQLLYHQGDATSDDSLKHAGIQTCKALIAAMPDDANNLFTVLTARQLNPSINIISRAKEVTSEKKLRLAGANHTIMPEQIGGFYIANLVNKPETIEFFNYITEQTNSGFGFEELESDNLPLACLDKTIYELEIRKNTGTNIIGFKKENGEYVVNPHPNTKFSKGTSFIVLGTVEQLKKLKDFLKGIEA